MSKLSVTCSICGTSIEVKPSVAKKIVDGKRKISCGTVDCKRELRSLVMRGENNPAYGKTYRTKETHPEWAQKMSETHKKNGTLVGEKNPMKRADVAARMSKTRREKVTSNPAYREARSKDRKEAWKRGDYENVSVGKCRWYEHIAWDGNSVKLQGTWEVAFARRLDELQVAYVPHHGRWNYQTNETERSYYPDFYIPMWDVFVDVKGAFWNDEQKEKLDFVRKSNPDRVLIVATKNLLEEWKVDLLGVQKVLLSEHFSKSEQKK